MAAPSKDNQVDRVHYGVLPPNMGGGPVGLGDPDDRSLRKVEKEIVIPKLMKERALKLCSDEVKAFCECGKREGLLLPFKCRRENIAQAQCLIKWYKDERFVEEVTNSFLDQRAEYRRNGIAKSSRRM